MVTVQFFFFFQCVFLALHLNHVFYPEITFEGIRGHFFVALVKYAKYSIIHVHLFFLNENIQYYVRFTMLITILSQSKEMVKTEIQ